MRVLRVLLAALAASGHALRMPFSPRMSQRNPVPLRCGAPVLVASQIEEAIQQRAENDAKIRALEEAGQPVPDELREDPVSVLRLKHFQKALPFARKSVDAIQIKRYTDFAESMRGTAPVIRGPAETDNTIGETGGAPAGGNAFQSAGGGGGGDDLYSNGPDDGADSLYD